MAKRARTEPAPTRPPAAAAGERRSGAVAVDEPCQALWAWAVRSGMFDRHASTQRVRVLTAAPVRLEIAGALALAPLPPAADRGAGQRSKPRRGESTGGDPYSRGPARRPESVNFNPYHRIPGRKA